MKERSNAKYGAYKHWELERCLNDKDCPLDNDTITNLRFLIGVRHEIEHQMTDKIDAFLSAKLQACALNFDFYICKLFGDKYNLSKELSLAIQFSPLTPEQRDTLHENSHITSNMWTSRKSTPCMLREPIKAIYVEAPDKSSGKRRQKIHIEYDGIGFIPLEELAKNIHSAKA